MLEFLLFNAVGIGAMLFAYWVGPDDAVLSNKRDRMRFAGGLGMVAGLIFGVFALPITDITPPFTTLPLNVSMLCAGIMMIGYGLATMVYAYFYGKHIATQPVRKQ